MQKIGKILIVFTLNIIYWVSKSKLYFVNIQNVNKAEENLL